MIYDLGIVIPVYRSKESVKRLIGKLERIFLPDIRIRICLVDDSNDEEITGYLKTHCLSTEVTLIVLDGNYGQQAALLCGLSRMPRCRMYGTIDDDLEQPPQMLLKLYQRVQNGCDLAYGIPVYDSSRRPVYRRLGSWLRDVLFSCLLGVPAGTRVSSLRVMRAHVVKKAICYEADDQNGGFFYLSAAAIKGAKKSNKKLRLENLYYRPGARYDGKSGYSPGRLFRLYGNILWHYGLGLPVPGHQKKGSRIKDMVHGETLMILGGSNCQLHGAERASALGIKTILADYTKKPPAAAVCGKHERISTFDIEACVEAARRHQVTGIMTMGTDQPVYTAACVCQELGLPALLTVDQAFSVTNKKRMKQILTAAGIPTVNYRIVDSRTKAGELSDLKAPLVIKPLDSQGQRGIYKLRTAAEILEHLEDTLSFSRCREALVEEYYDSDEVTVSGWIKDGILTVLTVTDRLLYPDQTHIGVCIGHRFPSVYMDQYQEILDISRDVTKAFGLAAGPFYLQLLIGRDGIRVNELAARIGGAFEDVFIPWISGFDILGAVLVSALGRPADTDISQSYRPDHSRRCVAVQLLFCSPGRIGQITGLDELLGLPYVLDAGYNYQPGQDIPVMENATARFGHAVICGTKDNIGARVDDFYRHLSVRSDTGEELIQRF
ncbi:MAG: glycosyltransferase [Lachnospiraceae bacterium]